MSMIPCIWRTQQRCWMNEWTWFTSKQRPGDDENEMIRWKELQLFCGLQPVDRKSQRERSNYCKCLQLLMCNKHFAINWTKKNTITVIRGDGEYQNIPKSPQTTARESHKRNFSISQANAQNLIGREQLQVSSSLEHFPGAVLSKGFHQSSPWRQRREIARAWKFP